MFDSKDNKHSKDKKIIKSKCISDIRTNPAKTTNEVKKAAALRYSPGNNNAPVLVAAGKGEIAEKIIEKANENNVPVYEDAGLANKLNKQKLWTEIPAELYGVVAEILVFISSMDSDFGEKHGNRREYK